MTDTITSLIDWSDQEIRALRGPKSPVDSSRPYGAFVEPERTEDGRVALALTVLITNRECAYTCLMCDLWRNTTDQTVPAGSIVRQVRFAIRHHPEAAIIKLYNSGSFMDPRAIPAQELPGIAKLVERFERVIVECHPALVGPSTAELNRLLGGRLEVAMGLETVHPQVLERLNKRMTCDDFARAARFLAQNGIPLRTFILLRPPYLSEMDGVEWAHRSLDFAWECAALCCVLIPTRGGNGAMDALARAGLFAPPRIESLEETLAYGIGRDRGRVLADLWDAERIATCPTCRAARLKRLHTMNLTQTVSPPVVCRCRNDPS